MERNVSLIIENLSDEEILKEFTKRFECDGAILLYMEDNKEYGFGRWTNKSGQFWVKELFKTIKLSPYPNIHIKKRNRIKNKKGTIN